MARKFLKKNNKTVAFSGPPSTNDLSSLWSAAIFPVKSDNGNSKISMNNMGIFLLNPSTWEEHKTSNWIAHDIPGQSDPILQWTSGGARTVTFEALVTKDHSGYNLTDPPSVGQQLINDALNVVGNIASSFLGVNVPPIGDLLPIGGQGAGQELSIADQLNYYRSLCYPLTDPDKLNLKQSPPLVALFVGNTFSKNMASFDVGLDTNLWVVTDLRIKVTKQLSNLAPIEAYVSFQLTEYIRRNKSSDDFSFSVDQQQASTETSVGQSLLNAVTGSF